MSDSTQDKEYLKGLTVLYVEDEEDARVQFTKFLSSCVGGVMVAKNGAEGLAIHDTYHPQIIITDIQMPLMDGLHMIKEIRALDQHVPVIVLTAFEEIEYLKKAIDTGVYKYLTKPIDGFRLHEALIECAHRLMTDELLKFSERTDQVTGLINRWELTNRFQAEKVRAEMYGSSFSMIFADIDKFHELNQKSGRTAGDQVLKDIADIMTSVFHPEDIYGRWENDTFLAILPHKDIDSAREMADQLLGAVQELSDRLEGEGQTVTMSMGIGSFRPGMSMYECMRLLNNALHKVKAGGRNRIELSAQSRSNA